MLYTQADVEAAEAALAAALKVYRAAYAALDRANQMSPSAGTAERDEAVAIAIAEQERTFAIYYAAYLKVQEVKFLYAGQ